MIVVVFGTQIHDAHFDIVRFIIQAARQGQGLLFKVIAGNRICIIAAKIAILRRHKCAKAVGKRHVHAAEKFVGLVGCTGQFEFAAEFV